LFEKQEKERNQVKLSLFIDIFSSGAARKCQRKDRKPRPNEHRLPGRNRIKIIPRKKKLKHNAIQKEIEQTSKDILLCPRSIITIIMP